MKLPHYIIWVIFDVFDVGSVRIYTRHCSIRFKHNCRVLTHTLIPSATWKKLKTKVFAMENVTFWHPKWLQRFGNMIVHRLLSSVQGLWWPLPLFRISSPLRFCSGFSAVTTYWAVKIKKSNNESNSLDKLNAKENNLHHFIRIYI